MTPTPVQIRTIRGVTWLNAADMTQRLRELSTLHQEEATNLGIFDVDDPQRFMLLGAAQRFGETADDIDFAIIGYLTEHPGDSPDAEPTDPPA